MHPRLNDVPGHELVDQIRRGKISLVIARSIVREIAGGNLPPGSPLPTEQAMATQYGVGRASVREALRLLELQGIVEIRRGNGGGPVVGVSVPQRFGETMTMHLQVRGASMADLHESILYLEPLGAERAAQIVKEGNADPQNLAALLQESRIVLTNDDKGQAFVASGERFHELIRKMAPNPVLDLVSDAVNHIYASRTASGGATLFSDETRRTLHMDHIQIADAIQRGKPHTARELMRNHMRAGTAAIFEVFPDIPGQLVDWQ